MLNKHKKTFKRIDGSEVVKAGVLNPQSFVKWRVLAEEATRVSVKADFVLNWEGTETVLEGME